MTNELKRSKIAADYDQKLAGLGEFLRGEPPGSCSHLWENFGRLANDEDGRKALLGEFALVGWMAVMLAMPESLSTT